MADHYLQFSEVLELYSDPIIRDEQISWVRNILGAYLDTEDVNVAKATLECNGIDTQEIDLEFWCDFSWQVESDHLWIYSEEYSNVYNVGLFVRAFMNKFNVPGVWCLQWSETCSKPRIGAFGGGVIAVNSHHIEIKSIRDVMTEMSKKLTATKTA